jgi:chitodextrinase
VRLLRTLLLAPVLALALAACGSGESESPSGPGTPPPAGPDTSPPTAPTGLTASPAGSTAIDLAWNASTDNVGVVGYVVRRNGVLIGTAATPNYLDTGLSAATTYSYSVTASDAAGNVSTATSVSGMTAGPGGDTTPPSTPTGLTASAGGSTVINLQWNASSDDVGVNGYIVRRDGLVVANPTSTTHADTGRSPGTTYNYTVAARDAANNTSPESAVVTGTTDPAGGGTLPLGALLHDGPATPEQISLVLPITGALAAATTATCRYKVSSDVSWTTCHPLFRVNPSFSNSPAVGGAVAEVFAWPIIDLEPGTQYNVEVTVNDGSEQEVKNLTHTTRALPAQAGAATVNVSAGSTAAQIASAINGAAAGAVIQIASGTYDLSAAISLTSGGTSGNPKYVRGASRTGTILSRSSGSLFSFGANVTGIVFENMTLQGSASDSGTAASSVAFDATNSTFTHSFITIRHLIAIGFDRFAYFHGGAQSLLVYDNTITGNNLWQTSPTNFLGTNLTWNDDGIHLAGKSNAAFNNTIRGFGDTFAYASHSGSDVTADAIGVHYYRNDIYNSTDDPIEVDHARRNVTWYDNRSHNTINCSSIDPLYGGPWLSARNICINPYRVNVHKWNDQNTGHFLYNNTVIATRSVGADADAANWYQPSNGEQRKYGYRNNLHVYRGDGQSIWIETTTHNPIDWTHNSWYPDRQIQWGGTFANLAAAQAGLASTTPIFSGSGRRMLNDNIVTSNPWNQTVTLGTNANTEITDVYAPSVAAGSNAKNSGAAIPNITDGFSGAAPDRGAIIEGRAILQYGDRTQ